MSRTAAAILTLAACSAPAAPENPAATLRAPLVVAESGPSGGRLVALDESGDRLFDVVRSPGANVRDSNPAISPDGQWLVFASSRGRAPAETALWLAPLGSAVEPLQITDPKGPAVDTHPTWLRDGSGIVFSSTRAGTFDLWRAPFEVVAGTPRIGELVRLTSAEDQEVTPSVGPEGQIAYAAVRVQAAKAGGEPEARARIEVWRPDGTITALTEGPGDGSPAYSPDGKEIAFTRPKVRERGVDAELWAMPAAGGPARPLLELPGTDEHGPVWSRDGRFLFATSLWRGADGRPKISLVIFFEVGATPPVARVLIDRVGAVNRITPALSREPLRAEVLRAAPPYVETLREIMRNALERRPASDLVSPQN